MQVGKARCKEYVEKRRFQHINYIFAEADLGQTGKGFSDTDLKDEISELAEPAPEPEAAKTDNKPVFKAPKFTPKTDAEYEQVDEVEDVAPEEEDTYGEGISENDDFASFGGVEETDDYIPPAADGADLRGMDIMDMDFDSFKDSREPGRWETYGDEEIVDFDKS